MFKTRPWREIQAEIRADPARAARIDAIKREMDRQLEAHQETEGHHPGGSDGFATHEAEKVASSPVRDV